MDNKSTMNFVCKLCGQDFDEKEMSEEHYPARSTGNEDIVSLDIVKMIDSIMSGEIHNEVLHRTAKGEEISDISEDIFDTQLSKALYPDGRTSRTLCKKCNTFLGKYDEAYLKFFNVDGNPKIVKGFQQITKLEIILNCNPKIHTCFSENQFLSEYICKGNGMEFPLQIFRD